MMVSVRPTDSAAGSRGFPWPVLEAGNGSFPGGAYSVHLTYREHGRSFDLRHHVEGAPLIEAWIQEGKARFACAVASPVSAYREVVVSSEASHRVAWRPDDLGSYPLFTPMIVCAEGIDHRIDRERDGVNPMWDRVDLHLAKGSRLAVCHTFALQSGLIGILDFVQDANLGAGQFYIQDSTENGFRFKVKLAPDLHRYLQHPVNQQDAGGANMMTHIVSAALACLQKNYADDNGEEGWRSHPNLVALAGQLEEKRQLGWWEDEFRPEEVATFLHPHKIAEKG